MDLTGYKTEVGNAGFAPSLQQHRTGSNAKDSKLRTRRDDVYKDETLDGTY